MLFIMPTNAMQENAQENTREPDILKELSRNETARVERLVNPVASLELPPLASAVSAPLADPAGFPKNAYRETMRTVPLLSARAGAVPATLPLIASAVAPFHEVVASPRIAEAYPAVAVTSAYPCRYSFVIKYIARCSHAFC